MLPHCAAREILSVMPLTSSIHSMAQIDISTSGVKLLLDNLKPHKASGPDSIPPMIVKELGNEIAPILQIISQISLTTGQVAYRTTGNKEANVAPIFKKGDKHKPSNYGPVSLTCITSTIMQYIFVSYLMKLLEIQNIIFPLQHGFRRNHSCESQLLSLFQELTSGTTQTDMLIMDFSWEKTWLMQFNADMRAGRSKTKTNASYKLHDHNSKVQILLNILA